MQTPIRLPGRVRLEQTLAVVIPSYRVKAHILDVIARIGPEVAMIFVVDDACPDGSGAYVGEQCRDPRVRVVRKENGGTASARNAGITVARGHYVALLDSDTTRAVISGVRPSGVMWAA